MKRVKDEILHIVQDALALFKCRKANKEWIIKQGGRKYTKIEAWDDDNFEMSGLNTKVRFVRFIEEIHVGDKVELKVRSLFSSTFAKFSSASSSFIALYTDLKSLANSLKCL